MTTINPIAQALMMSEPKLFASYKARMAGSDQVAQQMSQAAGPINPPSAKPPLLTDIESLTQQVFELQKILEELGTRLQPVLAVREPSEQTNYGKDQTMTGSCALSCQLNNASIALLGCKSVVLFILRNLEI